jgi:hypothetical protein
LVHGSIQKKPGKKKSTNMRFFLAFMLGMTSIAIAEHTALTDANWNTVRRLFMTVVRRIGAEPPHLASTAESEIRFLAHMAHG